MTITFHDVKTVYSIGMFWVAFVYGLFGKFDRATYCMAIAIYFKD